MASLAFVKDYILLSSKKKIEKALQLEVDNMGESNPLRAACEFSLMNGGKRFRPILVMLIADAIGKKHDVMNAALSIEFFHTASIIADDLPCMDDETKRRCKPALHLAFDEGTALLASYSLISSGYEMILKNSNSLKDLLSESQRDRICIMAVEAVSKYAGIRGATGGQYLDLYTKDFSLENINKIIHLKTISLFEIAFVLGWLFGGGEIDKLDLVKKCAYHFGMAFQIADDLKDFGEDFDKKKDINIAISLGKEKATDLFYKELENLETSLKNVNLYTKSLKHIITILQKATS